MSAAMSADALRKTPCGGHLAADIAADIAAERGHTEIAALIAAWQAAPGLSEQTRREVTAAMPAVYAFRDAGGEVKAQKYSGPQKAVDFVKAIQGLMIRNTHAPGQQQ